VVYQQSVNTSVEQQVYTKCAQQLKITFMKSVLFIFFIICPLWVCSSCDDDYKYELSGTKPEIFLGKWEGLEETGFLEVKYYRSIYEFTKTSASITRMQYNPKEDKYAEPSIRNFKNWSYIVDPVDGELLYFAEQDGRLTSKWARSVGELTPESVRFGGYKHYKKQ
jgi:hypothetical protein